MAIKWLRCGGGYGYPLTYSLGTHTGCLIPGLFLVFPSFPTSGHPEKEESDHDPPDFS